MGSYFKETFGFARKNPGRYLLLVLLAFLFISSAIGLGTYAGSKIMLGLKQIQDIVTLSTPFIGERLSDPSSLTPLLQQYSTIMGVYRSLQKNTVMLFLGMFLLWMILGGVSYHVLLKPKKLKRYILRFFLYSAGYYAVFIIITYFIIKLLVGVIKQSLHGIDPIMTFYLILSLVTGYFAFISFSLLDEGHILKKTFFVGLKKPIIVVYLIGLVGTGILCMLGMLLYKIYPLLILIPLLLMFFFAALVQILLAVKTRHYAEKLIR